MSIYLGYWKLFLNGSGLEYNIELKQIYGCHKKILQLLF